MQLLVNIDVDDLAEAERFYGEAFGLTIRRRFGTFGVEMTGANAAIFLLAKPPGSAASVMSPQTRDYSRHWTPVHLDIVVDDIDAAVGRLLLAGAVPESDIRDHAWGRIAQFADPFGNGFCVLQFVGRGYDEIADAPAAT